MTTEIGEWLADLEWDSRSERESGESYLWPHTPVGNLQAEAMFRVGVSDYNVKDGRCRTTSVLNILRRLLDNSLIESDFTMLDLCCGDAVVAAHVGHEFQRARVYGVDLLRYDSHLVAERNRDCVFYYAPIQKLVNQDSPRPIDVVMMLNTFRNWDSAKLPDGQESLPYYVTEWMARNAKFIIVTCDQDEEVVMKVNGWWLTRIGPGEDGTNMVLGFRCFTEGLGGDLWKASAKLL